MKPSRLRFLMVLSLSAGLGMLGVMMIPLAVGAFAKDGIGADTLGVMVFLELISASLIAIAASKYMAKIHPINFCLAGSLIYAIGNLGSAFALDSVPALLAFRPLTGFGTGLLGAGVVTLIARLPNPDSVYGYTGIAPSLAGLIGFALVPILISLTGDAFGVFAFQAAVAIINLVMLWTQRDAVNTYIVFELAQNGEQQVTSDIIAHVDGPSLGLPMILLSNASMFLICLADGMVWTFVTPIAAGAGIDLGMLSVVLIVTSIVSVGGPLLAGWLGDRLGVLLPLLVGQFIMMGTSMLMVAAHSPWLFLAAHYPRILAMMYLLPRYNSLFARLDPGGRLVTSAGGSAQIGYALGPLIGGLLVSLEAKQFLALGAAGTAAAAASLICTLVVVFKHQAAAAGRFGNGVEGGSEALVQPEAIFFSETGKNR